MLAPTPAKKEEPGHSVCLARRNALVYHPVQLDLLLKGRAYRWRRSCRPPTTLP
jgi:hypothetical protein